MRPAHSRYVPLIIAATDAFLLEDCAASRRYAEQALQIRPGDTLASELLFDSLRADYMAYTSLAMLKDRYRAARDSLEPAPR